jgi:hypothetical protein
MQIVLDFLIKIPGAKDRIVKQNEEEMWLAREGYVKPKGVRSAAMAAAATDTDDNASGSGISKMLSYPS